MGNSGSVRVVTEDCVTSCSLVEIYRRFGLAYYAYTQNVTVKAEFLFSKRP